MEKNNLLGNALLLLCAVIWGGAFIAQTTGLDTMGPVTFNGIRSLIGAATLFVFMLIRAAVRHEPLKISKREWLCGIPCGVIVFIALTTQQIGLGTVPPGRAGFLSAIYIVLVPLFRTIGGKKATANSLIAVALTLCGLTLMSVAGSTAEGEAVRFSSLFSGFSLGDVLMLVCAFSYSFQIIIVDDNAEHLDPVNLCFLQFGISGLIAIPFILVFEGMPSGADLLPGLSELLYTGMLSSALAYTLQIAGQKLSTNPTVAAVLMSTESVFAAIFGVLLLHERHKPLEYLGCFIVFCAIIICQLPPLKRKTK